MVIEIDIAPFKIMNQDFMKLNQFYETIFTGWQDKIVRLRNSRDKLCSGS